MRQYHDLLRDILDNGVRKDDRTGTGTLSVFGRQFRHDLADGFPLLTTKKLHLRSIVNELIWFLNGDTNVAWLQEHGVSIWNEWATDTGDLGPVYGKQWRAWPTRDGQEVDQIEYVLDCLKNRPDSRRILFHAWNVEYLPDESLSPQENVRAGRMALPPCHLLYQFYVANGRLSAQLYIRSSDTFLGLPFNTASLAVLLMMLAQQSDLEPGEIIISTGDSHLYVNHLEQVREQLSRDLRPLPALVLRRRPDSMYDYCLEDFELCNYDPHPHISAPVAV